MMCIYTIFALQRLSVADIWALIISTKCIGLYSVYIIDEIYRPLQSAYCRRNILAFIAYISSKKYIGPYNVYEYEYLVDPLFVQFIFVQPVFPQPVFVQRCFCPTLDSSNLLSSMTYIRPICFRPILVHFLFLSKNTKARFRPIFGVFPT